MLKRYKFTARVAIHNWGAMDESETGEYVKYEDVKSVERLGIGAVHCGSCGADMSNGNHLESCYIVQTNIDGIGQPFGVMTYQDNT